MKTTIRRTITLPLHLLASSLIADSASSEPLEGAWHSTEGSVERVLLVVDGYWTHTAFDEDEPQFHRAFGGPLKVEGTSLTSVLHFDSAEPARVGKRLTAEVDQSETELQLRYEDGTVETWQPILEYAGPLTGVWRISGRQRDGEMQEMPLSARRTLKILSGSRFQWVAMNIETGEFSGTGGGTYTFDNGTYTEVIEFFSRDKSRVGARLEFQGEVRNDDWHHSGLSSRGDPIDEVWSQTGPVPLTVSIEEAIARGDLEDLRRHVAADPDVLNRPIRGGLTPLHLAVMRNKVEVVELLLDLGADPTQPTPSQETLLHLAVNRKSAPMCTLLLKQPLDLSAKDKGGWTVWHQAAAKGALDLIDLFAAHGHLPDQLSEAGGTPLHEAAVSANAAVVRRLLELGVDSDVVSKDGRTALDIAIEYKNQAAIALLQQGVKRQLSNPSPRS